MLAFQPVSSLSEAVWVIFSGLPRLALGKGHTSHIPVKLLLGATHAVGCAAAPGTESGGAPISIYVGW